MAKKAYYAVAKGRQVGIFDTWEECQKQTNGFSGPIFKKFVTYEEAIDFLKDNGVTLQEERVEKFSPVGELTEEKITDELEAYVDGSFDSTLKIYGSGIVLVKNDRVIDKLAIIGQNEKYVESYQIAGEAFAAIEAMKWAIDKGYASIVIYYDYRGIEDWARGAWSTNKPVSKDYKAEFDKLSKDIKVSFVKVKAHSGVTFNELADSLARQAINK